MGHRLAACLRWTHLSDLRQCENGLRVRRRPVGDLDNQQSVYRMGYHSNLSKRRCSCFAGPGAEQGPLPKVNAFLCRANGWRTSARSSDEGRRASRRTGRMGADHVAVPIEPGDRPAGDGAVPRFAFLFVFMTIDISQYRGDVVMKSISGPPVLTVDYQRKCSSRRVDESPMTTSVDDRVLRVFTPIADRRHQTVAAAANQQRRQRTSLTCETEPA
jgi:hypothetical protein